MTDIHVRPGRTDGLRLIGLAALTAALLSSGALAAPVTESLPVAPAAVSGQAPGSAGAQEGDDAARVAALQQQIAAQQAQLTALEQHLRAQAASSPAAVAGGEDGRAGPAPGGESVVVNGREVGHPAPATPAASATLSGSVVAAPASAPSAGAPSSSPVPADAPAAPGAGSTDGTAPAADNAPLALTTEAQRQAYASGVSVWRDIDNSLTTQRAMGIALDRRYVMAGLEDMYARRPLKMSREAMDTVMSTLNAQYADQAREVKEHQEAEGKAYRIAFSKKKGAYSDAGSWYQITDKGTGRHLRTSDMAELQVTGMLPDGTVFDPSGQNGQTKTVKVGALLPAVAIGLQKVGAGGHITVVVPPGKGYGDAGLPPAIPGGATLIFDIQVKGISTGK